MKDDSRFISATSYFISATSYRITPISENEWKEQFKSASYFNLLEQYIPTGEIFVTTGKFFCVSWMKPHECDCEFCEEMEGDSRFFYDKKDAEKFMKKIERDIGLDDIDLDDYYYIKVIKPLPQNEGLFK